MLKVTLIFYLEKALGFSPDSNIQWVHYLEQALNLSAVICRQERVILILTL